MRGGPDQCKIIVIFSTQECHIHIQPKKNNLLYSAVEEAAEKHTAIDFHRIQHILHPGDIVLIGFGQNSAHDTLFEIQGLRWAYNGAVYRALIAPRARYRQIPGIE